MCWQIRSGGYIIVSRVQAESFGFLPLLRVLELSRVKSSANNAWAKRRKTSATKAASQGARTPSKPAKLAPVQLPIVGIGASAGGLEAFTELLHNLPTDTGMAFVLVQHLDPAHASALTQLLSKATSIPVREVTNNLPIEPNQVYVIPPNTDLAIAQGALKLQPRLHTAGAHRSIDFFFQSLAQDQHKRAIGVVLSGAASDGTLGLEAIKAEGGITFAQDESAKYDSMPRSAIAAGCVDFVLAPEKIAKELARIVKHPLVVGGARTASSASLAGAAQKADTPSTVKAYPTEDGFKKILLLLRNHSAVDFSLYKSSTIQRRINRRMVLNKLNTFDAYAQ